MILSRNLRRVANIVVKVIKQSEFHTFQAPLLNLKTYHSLHHVNYYGLFWKKKNEKEEIIEKIDTMNEELRAQEENLSPIEVVEKLERIIELQEQVEERGEMSLELLNFNYDLIQYILLLGQYKESITIGNMLLSKIDKLNLIDENDEKLPKILGEFYILQQKKKLYSLLTQSYQAIGNQHDVILNCDKLKSALDDSKALYDNHQKELQDSDDSLKDELSVDLGFEAGYGEYYQILANIHHTNQNIQEAISCNEKALQSFQNCIEILNKLKKQPQVEEESEDQMDIEAALLQYNVQSASVLESIGSIKFDLREFDEALEYFEKSSEVYSQFLGQKSLEYINSLQSIGMIQMELLNFQRGYEIFKECIELLEDINQTNAIMALKIYINLVKNAMRTGEQASVIKKYLHKCQKIITQYKVEYWKLQLEVSMLLMQDGAVHGQYKQAIKVGESSLKMLNQYNIQKDPVRIKLVLLQAQIWQKVLEQDKNLDPQDQEKLQQLIEELKKCINLLIETFGEEYEYVAEAYLTLSLLIQDSDIQKHYMDKAINIATKLDHMRDYHDAYYWRQAKYYIEKQDKQQAKIALEKAINCREDYNRLLKHDVQKDGIMKIYQEKLASINE